MKRSVKTMPVPTEREIERLIDEALTLQKHRDTFTTRGRRYRVLAVYWHKGRKVVLKVDEKRNKVVTVLA